MPGESAKNRKISLGAQSLYPHLKITGENFPRLLVTRKIENDAAEYFGPFLPETGVRFFIDFLNKIFKLRTCTIDIDGSFDVPCPQFYARRCLAPCVRNLCGEKEYSESAGFARLFLDRQKEVLTEKLLDKIEAFAAENDFETAAEWRDKLNAVEDFWRKNEGHLWLDDATDSWEIEPRGDETFVFLVTMRRRKNLGRRVFVFENEYSAETILENILPEFYRFHAPAEIRVSDDFASRKTLADALSKRENRKIKIVVTNKNNRKKTIDRAVRRNKHEFDLRNIKRPISALDLRKEIKRIFNLKQTPKRIEAFDVAHISGANPVGACAVWKDGKFAADEYKFWLFDAAGELEALENSVFARFSNDKNAPDLILIDGGRPQLNAALKALENFEHRTFSLISAVKPPRRHGEISYFLLESGEKILFENDSDTFRFMQRLRDEAHAAANSVHRTSRDFSHFYELAAVLPNLAEKTRREILRKTGSINKLKNISFEDLKAVFDLSIAEIIRSDLVNYKQTGGQKIAPPIIPIRYDDPNGDANDLQPLAV